MKTILFAALVAFGLAVHAATPDVFLLMGQSNMAGYGALLPQDKLPHEGQWVLRGTPGKDVRWEVPHAAFVPSAGLRSHDGYNVHFDRSSYVILGARYFDAYWRLVTPETPALPE